MNKSVSRRERRRPSAEFLLEIGCEEIPAGMIPGAANELQVILKKYLGPENLIDDASVEAFGAPRRLVATCAGFDSDRKISAAKSRGRRSRWPSIPTEATRAAESFAAKQGVGSNALPGEHAARRIHGREADYVGREGCRASGRDSAPGHRGDPLAQTMYWTGAAGCDSSGRFVGWWRCSADSGAALNLADVAVGNDHVGTSFPGQIHDPRQRI